MVVARAALPVALLHLAAAREPSKVPNFKTPGHESGLGRSAGLPYRRPFGLGVVFAEAATLASRRDGPYKGLVSGLNVVISYK